MIQIISYLNGEITKKRLKNEIILKTYQYAKKQIKWFKKERIDFEINITLGSNLIVKKIIHNYGYTK